MVNTEAVPPKKGVFDLVDVVEERQNGHSSLSAEQTIYDLVDAVGETLPPVRREMVSKEDIMKQVAAIAEKTARELFPEIAERIIREEIAKLKAEQEQKTAKEEQP
ncbi:MAG: hypothetical protein LBV07_02285 [Syntrophobacterales bacterium]|jgi:hypothetical protein|nr:hypothetical protein [Syntrophobacterales bacterium]